MAKKKDIEFKPKFSGLETKEKKWASYRFKDYLSNYPHIHKFSQLLTLEELVFTEALHERIKSQIEQIIALQNKTDSEESLLPRNIQEALEKSNETQFKLKDRLGLFEDKTKLDAFRDFEQMKEDFREYRRRFPHLFGTTCPQCSYKYFLKRRTDCYEEIDAPWFKDKILCNPELWDAYKCGEITKSRISRILGVSEDYIDWLGEKIFAVKNENLNSNEISLESFSLPNENSSEKSEE